MGTKDSLNQWEKAGVFFCLVVKKLLMLMPAHNRLVKLRDGPKTGAIVIISQEIIDLSALIISSLMRASPPFKPVHGGVVHGVKRLEIAEVSTACATDRARLPAGSSLAKRGGGSSRACHWCSSCGDGWLPSQHQMDRHVHPPPPPPSPPPPQSLLLQHHIPLSLCANSLSQASSHTARPFHP